MLQGQTELARRARRTRLSRRQPGLPRSCSFSTRSRFDPHDSQAGLWEPSLWSPSPCLEYFSFFPTEDNTQTFRRACRASRDERPLWPLRPSIALFLQPLSCPLLSCPALPRDASGWPVSVQCPGDLVCPLLLPSLPRGSTGPHGPEKPHSVIQQVAPDRQAHA